MNACLCFDLTFVDFCLIFVFCPYSSYCICMIIMFYKLIETVIPLYVYKTNCFFVVCTVHPIDQAEVSLPRLE